MLAPSRGAWLRGPAVVATLIAFLLSIGPSLASAQVLPPQDVAFPLCRPTNPRVNGVPDAGSQWDPAVALRPNGLLYAAWVDPRDEPAGASSIYVGVSDDNGTTWTDLNRSVNEFGPGANEDPAVAVGTDGVLYVAWRGGQDVYVGSSPDGVEWGAAVRVNDVSSFGTVSESRGPAIAVSPNGTILVAWEDWRNGEPDIYAASSADDGRTWRPNVRVNDDFGGAEQRGDPALSVDALGVAYLAWQDARDGPGDPDIFAAVSLDGGRIWSANERVNDDTGAAWQGDPDIEVDFAGTAHVVWQDNRHGTGEVYYARSPSGYGWRPNYRLTEDPATAKRSPSIASEGNQLYAAWLEDGRIAIASSSNGGLTWTDSFGPVNVAGVALGGPALVAGSNGAAYLAWVDDRDVDWDVYSSSCSSPSTSGGFEASVFPYWVLVPLAGVGVAGLSIMWLLARPRKP